SFPRFADSPGATFCRPLRGLHSLFVIFSPGSPTHRGLLSVARCAGSTLCSSSFPRFPDSPGATFCRPLRGLHSLFVIFSPGSPTHRGLLSVARCAGSTLCSSSFPRFPDSPGATFCRPLRGLHSLFVIFPPVRRLTGGYF